MNFYFNYLIRLVKLWEDKERFTNVSIYLSRTFWSLLGIGGYQSVLQYKAISSTIKTESIGLYGFNRHGI